MHTTIPRSDCLLNIVHGIEPRLEKKEHLYRLFLAESVGKLKTLLRLPFLQYVITLRDQNRSYLKHSYRRTSHRVALAIALHLD